MVGGLVEAGSGKIAIIKYDGTTIIASGRTLTVAGSYFTTT